jgi:uncharacterized protein with HEPN domain
MTQHDPWVRIRHMLKHAREAVALARSRHRSDFDGDRVLQLAMTRLVEIVGEAASKVAPDVRQRYSSVPWNQIVGMRQRLVHGYDSVDLEVLWDTVTDDLPTLVKQLEAIIPGESADGP